METICLHYGLPIDEPKGVQIADEIMLATEARDLMQPLHPEWSEWLVMTPLAQRITPWHPEPAERAFIERFAELTRPPQARSESDEIIKVLARSDD
jgi:hypothetical protein